MILMIKQIAAQQPANSFYAPIAIDDSGRIGDEESALGLRRSGSALPQPERVSLPAEAVVERLQASDPKNGPPADGSFCRSRTAYLRFMKNSNSLFFSALA